MRSRLRPACRRLPHRRWPAPCAKPDLLQTALQTERYLERGLRNEQLCALGDDLGGYYNDYVSLSAAAADVQAAVSSVADSASTAQRLRGSALNNAVQIVAVLNVSHALKHEAFTARHVRWEVCPVAASAQIRTSAASTRDHRCAVAVVPSAG